VQPERWQGLYFNASALTGRGYVARILGRKRRKIEAQDSAKKGEFYEYGVPWGFLLAYLLTRHGEERRRTAEWYLTELLNANREANRFREDQPQAEWIPARRRRAT
jgi:hypothetical protein